MFAFFNAVLQFFDVTIYQLLTDFVAFLIIQLTILKIELQISSLIFSWDIAKQVISQLNVVSEINSSLSLLPPDTLNLLNFFNVPAGLNLVLNAAVTKYVMNFARF
jgi:hypothetical protein